MAATLAQIKDGLETRLNTISGLRVRDYVPSSIEPPMAVITFLRKDFHGAMQQGMVPFEFAVTVLVGAMTDRSAQANLLAYADTSGTYSIRAAIEGDRTLGLSNTDCVVDDVEAFTTESIGGYSWLACQFSVRVHTR